LVNCFSLRLIFLWHFSKAAGVWPYLSRADDIGPDCDHGSMFCSTILTSRAPEEDVLTKNSTVSLALPLVVLRARPPSPLPPQPAPSVAGAVDAQVPHRPGRLHGVL
jgi:hypothetical protein